MGNSSKRSRSSSEAGEAPVFKEIKPLNYIQEEYLNAIKRSSIIYGVGSAGTGKTYLAAGYASSELFHRNIDKIIVTRPNVEVGRGLGFLPGTLEEKYAPYLDPFESAFIRFLGKGFYEYCVKAKTIEPKPLGFMRGATFDNAVVLFDEAQNATKEEFKMLLSRIGRNTKIIISGDDEQCDIPDSGLLDAIGRTSRIDGVSVVRFTEDDIVRSKMCRQIIIAYRS